MMQRKTPSILKLACAFTALSAAAVASPAQAFQPRDTHEVNAVNVRILQSEMMVTVVVRYQGELVSHARVLKKMFRRDHGARAQSELDGFVTQLANDASIRSIRERQTFCTNATKMFSSILSGENTLAATGLRTVEEAVVQEMPSK